ncbi:MAG: hypothetical protein HC913_05540 [Microscillaceae bacterium]|nr:hypothetical protein [Microscillaceae bacterium]
MKRPLHKSKYVYHRLINNAQTLYTHWFAETEFMPSQVFRQEMQIWQSIFVQYRPLALFNQCQDFLYPISPDEQVWLSQLLQPAFLKNDLRCYAHVVPEESISNISVMQLFQELEKLIEPGDLLIRHFHEEKPALEWLEQTLVM